MSNLVVQTNVLALNSHRNLKGIGIKTSQASARLSSGYRINSAADDASGLAISEKMRAQIRGLDMASKNTQDGMSLVQTAEGGLQEVDNMLQRIRELAVQAANDTNDFTTNDRKKIQDEINQLTQGIDTMAEQVEFNAKTLLDGSLLDDGTKAELLGDIDKKLAASIGAVRMASQEISDAGGELGELWTANSAGQTGTLVESQASGNISSSEGTVGGAWSTQTSNVTIGASSSVAVAGTCSTATDSYMTWEGTGGVTGSALVASQLPSSIITSGSVPNIGTIANNNSWFTVDATSNMTVAVSTETTEVWSTCDSIAAQTFGYGAIDETVYGTDAGLESYLADVNNYISNIKSAWTAEHNGQPMDDTTMTTITEAQEAIDAAKKLRAGYALQKAQESSYDALADPGLGGGGLWFQTGSNSNQGINVGVGSIKTNILGIGNGFGESKVALDQEAGMAVSNFIDIVDDALQYVTAQRAKLGAVQNRMEFTRSSLDISSENLAASESRIRDTDMAKEMMKMTSANVLQQAGVSMLAQANQAPQSVLQLLG